jgi:NitT/TauT family transport system substrate-binding protein
MMIYKIFALLAFSLFALPLVAEKTVIRVGHFPTISHAQGLIGHYLTRENKGWFEERLGPDVEIHWYVFEAGPSAMEAMFAGSLDLTYAGPSPTINAFVKSKGNELQIISGACSGGAALVVHEGGAISTPDDFRGKKLATPSFGNTQDIAARSWLTSNGFKIKMGGGDVYVIPTEASDQLTLFKKKELDAAWAIEPWVSRLILEANGKIYLNESSLWPETNGRYVTTHLVAHKKFLKDKPDIVKKWLQAHVELTDWIKANPTEAKEYVINEFKAETRLSLSKELVNKAWENLEFTYDPISSSLNKDAKEAYELGFIKTQMNLEGIYDLKLLNEILNEKGRETVK